MSTQLHTLIRLRQYEVDRAQVRLAEVQRQEREVVASLAELDRQIAEQRTQFDTFMSEGQLQINALRLRQQYLQQLTQERTQWQSKVSAAQCNSRECREHLIAVDQRLQVVQKLQERNRTADQARQQRQADTEIEEAWRVAGASRTM